VLSRQRCWGSSLESGPIPRRRRVPAR
jgi:hypothetical protein